VATQLAENGGDGKSREADAVVGVVTLDRLQQADLGHLDQIVEWFASFREAPRAVHGDPFVIEYEVVANGAVERLPIPPKAFLDVVGTSFGRRRTSCREGLLSHLASGMVLGRPPPHEVPRRGFPKTWELVRARAERRRL